MTTRIFTNGRLFTGADLNDAKHITPTTLVIKGSKIAHVGKDDDKVVAEARKLGAKVTDLNNRIVAPGFIDAHVHILFFGLSLQKLDLEYCNSLEEIRSAVSSYAQLHPELPRVLCRGWQQSSTDGKALARDLDDLDERPIYIEALDLHSSWCNTAALKELPIDRIRADCPSCVTCDESGSPTGLLSEAAVTQFIWPFLVKQCTEDELQAALGQAFKAYAEAGYTGIIDMAMEKPLWSALDKYRKTNGLPLHVAAHWFVPYLEDPVQRNKGLQEAIEMHRLWHPSKSRDFCVVGIKIISDGVVDGCTAALSDPYGGKTVLVHPIWPRNEMEETVAAAVKAGMQCAIHAIGDVAVTQSIDSIEAAQDPQGRHRIEHLEVTNKEDAARLGRIGITASVQPIHSDPARLIGYSKLLGPEKWSRAFPYSEFLAGNANVAIGSDAPTASHRALHNLYCATTRRSVVQPDFQGQTNPNGALTMVHALTAATYGAAYSRFAESWTGSLQAGLRADFVVLDTTWDSTKLLDAQVWETWAEGEKVYEASSRANL